MNIDTRATKTARSRHARGIRILDSYFLFTPTKAPLNAQTGRALESKRDRRIWRKWRDETFPKRVQRRKRRKIANASRRRNR